MIRSLTAVVACLVFLGAGGGYSQCCPHLEFTYGVEDWDGLEESCGDIGASTALRLDLPNMAVFMVRPGEFVFVHSVAGCVESIELGEHLYLSGDTEYPAIIGSSEVANVSIAWTSNEVSFNFVEIQISHSEASR